MERQSSYTHKTDAQGPLRARSAMAMANQGWRSPHSLGKKLWRMQSYGSSMLQCQHRRRKPSSNFPSTRSTSTAARSGRTAQLVKQTTAQLLLAHGPCTSCKGSCQHQSQGRDPSLRAVYRREHLSTRAPGDNHSGAERYVQSPSTAEQPKACLPHQSCPKTKFPNFMSR